MKKRLYAAATIGHYWLVDPDARTLEHSRSAEERGWTWAVAAMEIARVFRRSRRSSSR